MGDGADEAPDRQGAELVLLGGPGTVADGSPICVAGRSLGRLAEYLRPAWMAWRDPA